MRHLWNWFARLRVRRTSCPATPRLDCRPRPSGVRLEIETLEDRVVPSTVAVVGTGTGLTGQYFADTSLSRLVLTRTDATVNMTWGGAIAPAPGLPSSNYSVRWSGAVQAQFSETYTFTTLSDDGVRLFVNGQKLIDDWTLHAPRQDSGRITLAAGQKVAIEMDYYQAYGRAVAQLSWSSASTAAQIVPTRQLYTTAVTPPPAIDWFSQHLRDASLVSLTRGLDADHQLSRGDLLAVFNQVEKDGTVSANELADLRTLTANAAAVGLADPVLNLANKVVNGDPADLHYQGHALAALTSGQSAVVLQDLVGKWFLGLDHPATDAGVHYAAAAGSLFGAGPAYTDVKQGIVGDCYFAAALAETAFRDPSSIQHMFIDNGDGTYAVRFFHDGAADYVTVDRQLPATSGGSYYYANYQWSINDASRKLWVALAEKAYVQLGESGWSRLGQNANAYSAIATGWEGDVIRAVDNRTVASRALGNDAGTLNALVGAFQTGKMVGLDSKTTTERGIVASHVYVLVGYDAARQQFSCYNPWGYVQILTWNQVASNFRYWSATA